MRKSTWSFALFALLSLALSGCGSGGSGSLGPGAPQPSAVSLSITDAPPPGMAILSFQVTLNSAVLNPGNVDLLSGLGPVRIEVTRLATEIGFLNTASAPAGAYTSLQLTFADPELTFKNNTGNDLPGCASGEVCEFTSSNLPGPLASTINFPGTGLIVGSNSPFGLLVDLHLNTLLTNQSGLPGVDFGLAGAATAHRVNLPNQPTGTFQRVDDVQGIVVSKDATNNRFTLQTAFRGRYEVRVNNDTSFRDCPAADLTCVQVGQVVEVDMALIAGGVLFARSVELEERIIPRLDDALDGVIYQVDSSTQFQMVVTDVRRSIVGVLIGRRVTVALQSPVFEVADRGLTVPSILRTAFESAQDTSQLRIGQHVQVRRISLSTGPPLFVGTNRVRLLPSRFTANVSSIPTSSGSNFLFNVNGLSGLFTSAGITQIGVQTSPGTEFEGVTTATDLTIGRLVSLRGLLFADTNPSSLTLIADKVRAR